MKSKCFSAICFTLVFLPVVALTACAEDPARITCVIPDKLDTVFWSDIEDGIREEADAEDVRLSMIYTETGSGAMSINLNDAINIALLSSTDSLILSYNDADEDTDRELKEARRQGIRVVLVDSDAEEELRDGYVGIDNEQAGFELAGYALSQIDPEKKVLLPIMPNYKKKENFIARMQGIREAFEEFPDRLIEFDLPEYAEIQAASEIRKQILNGSGIGAIICCSERMSIMSAQALSSIRESGETTSDEIFLYGFDRSDETEKLLQSGLMKALVSQNSKKMGMESVKIACALLNEEDPENDRSRIRLVPFELLTDSEGEENSERESGDE